MEYIAYAVCIGVLFGFFVFLDEKRKELLRQIEDIYQELTRQNDKTDMLRADTDGLRRSMSDLRESVRVRDAQEKAMFDGMNSILNYSEAVARKAVDGHDGYGREED